MEAIDMLLPASVAALGELRRIAQDDPRTTDCILRLSAAINASIKHSPEHGGRVRG